MQTVLFDMDNTFLDRNGSIRDFAAWQARGMLRPYIDDVDAYVERFYELDNNGAVWKDRVYETLLDEFAIDGWTVNELVTSYELGFSGFTKPLPGATDAIQAVRDNGFRTAVVTNGKYPFQERNFGSLGMAHLFEAIFVSEAVGYRKPKPEIFLHVCEQLGIQPSDAIFAGDNPVADIQGANSVGMYTIYIPDRFGERCDEADAICRDLAHLPRLVTAARESIR